MPGFDVNSNSAIYGRHFHFAAKHSSREVEHKVVDEVFAVALEFVVGFFFNLNDEVAGDSAARSIVAVSLHAQEHTFSHAGGYVHAHHLFFAFESYAAAFRAAFFNNLAFAFAVRAHRLGLHLSEESLLHFSDIAGAVAVTACGEFGAVFCSGAFAVGASHHARYFELFLHAVSHFFEVNLHAHAQVGASFCGRALATRASEATKTAKSAESATENVAEIAENIVDIVETGTTLKENGLEVIEDVAPISARLIANTVSLKMRQAEIEKLIELKSSGSSDTLINLPVSLVIRQSC